MFKKMIFWCPMACAAALAVAAGASPYAVVERWPLPGNEGWDYLAVDQSAHLVYLSRATHVAVVDASNGKLVGDIPDTAGVHGIALAPDLGKGFISDGKANQVTVFDLGTRRVLATVAVGSKPDAILYDSATRRVFAFNGMSNDVSVIDALTLGVEATISLPGAPEFARSDAGGRVFVNLEDKNELAAIDSKALKVSAHWTLPACERPTGLAIDAVHHRSFSVCSNAVLAILDTENGRAVATLPIGHGVDGAEFDPLSQNLFSANGEGTVTVVHESDPDHFAVVQTLETAKGARTIAIDPSTRRLYLPTARFGVIAPNAGEPHPRPPILPDSVVLLVVAPSAASH